MTILILTKGPDPFGPLVWRDMEGQGRIGRFKKMYHNDTVIRIHTTSKFAMDVYTDDQDESTRALISRALGRKLDPQKSWRANGMEHSKHRNIPACRLSTIQTYLLGYREHGTTLRVGQWQPAILSESFKTMSSSANLMEERPFWLVHRFLNDIGGIFCSGRRRMMTYCGLLSCIPPKGNWQMSHHLPSEYLRSMTWLSSSLRGSHKIKVAA